MKRHALSLVLLLAVPALATNPNYVQSANKWTCGPPANTLVVTCSVPISSTGLGHLLAVWTFWQWTSMYGATYTAAVSDNATPASDFFYSAVGPTVQSATMPNPTSAQMFYAKSIAMGTTSVTVTFIAPPPPPGSGYSNATLSAASVVVVEYMNLDLTNPLDSVSAGYSTAGNMTPLLDSGNVNPANSNLTIFAAGFADPNVAMSAGSGFAGFQSTHSASLGTALAEDNANAITGNSVLQRATICLGTTAPCPTTSPGNWLMQMAVFRDASCREHLFVRLPNGLVAGFSSRRGVAVVESLISQRAFAESSLLLPDSVLN